MAGLARAARKYVLDLRVAEPHMPVQHGRDRLAKVRRHREVALLVKLPRSRAPAIAPYTFRPRTGPPITHITLPWPWSVPPLPFWRTVRPNSEMTRMTVSLIMRPERGRETRKPLAERLQMVRELARWTRPG